MDNYKKVKLSEVAEINIRQINKNSIFDNIIYIDIASVTKGTIDETQNIQTSKAPSRAKRLVKKNDILYSTVRPNLEHYTFIKDDLPNNTVASTGFAVITPNQDLVDPYYLYCLITQSQFTQYLSQVAEQAVSTYPTVSPNVIADLELSLPPLSEQKRISNILSSFDNKIEQLKKENNILENIAQTIFKEWFVNYNFPNKDGKPYKDSGGKMIDSELGLIPEGWRVGKLGEVLELKSGYPFSSKDYAEKSSQQIIRISDVKGKGIIDSNKAFYISNNAIQDSRAKDFILSQGDILISMSGSIGRIGIVPKIIHNTLYLNQRVGKLFFKKPLFRNYLHSLLLSNNLEEKISSMGYGSVQQNINSKQIHEIPFVIPSTDSLQNFNEKFTALINKHTSNYEETGQLALMKELLLNKLLK
ncbi:restriction endonuclease subunit S [Candidatus Dojkabacteria bacterium]|uniref:Restriction endonuclease subunit S n=1 Tax=Candidatus Dojkabacteria bacterium TaxID=2099670 RepID=A0A847VDY5_9BACT|nr:restriction endonuclease subunit S [Candidatus Dojkabacteria bacterium]